MDMHACTLLTPCIQKILAEGVVVDRMCTVPSVCSRIPRDTSIELHAHKMHNTIFLYDTHQPFSSRIMHIYMQAYLHIYI